MYFSVSFCNIFLKEIFNESKNLFIKCNSMLHWTCKNISVLKVSPITYRLADVTWSESLVNMGSIYYYWYVGVNIAENNSKRINGIFEIDKPYFIVLTNNGIIIKMEIVYLNNSNFIIKRESY